MDAVRRLEPEMSNSLKISIRLNMLRPENVESLNLCKIDHDKNIFACFYFVILATVY